MFRVVERGEATPIRPDALAQLTGSPYLPRLLRSLRGARRKTDVCPLCGWTLAQFEKTRLMGCGLCHTVFAGEKEPLEEDGAS